MPRNPEFHWTCHSCGQEIGDQQAITIRNGFIYHTDHAPEEKE